MKTLPKHVCSACGLRYLKWQGFCTCGQVGTINNIEPREPNRETARAKGIRRRAKNSERNIARRMTDIDGADPAFKHIASSTGRIGMITGIRVDAVSKNYVTEAKNRVLPKWLIDAWLLINQRSIDFSKNALLHLEPPNAPRDFVLNGMKYKLGTMAIITQDRHEDLIRAERLFLEIQAISQSSDSNVVKVRKIAGLVG